ncbi:MAG: hypothetical protein V9G13_12300 [Marmoricola sp.]
MRESAVTVAKILVLRRSLPGLAPGAWEFHLQALGVPGLSTWAELACFLTMVAGVVEPG